MFIQSKKGISPLIATVLLIAFAVALGAVVMNVSAGLIKEQTKTPSADCSTLALDIFTVREKPQVCFADKVITYRLTNNGAQKISDVKVQIVGEREVVQGTLGSQMAPADIKESSISYSVAKNGDIISARFIPLSDATLCQEQSVSVDEVKDC